MIVELLIGAVAVGGVVVLVRRRRRGAAVVFDPRTVACGRLRRVRDFPGGADRLVADAEGVRTVIVNGTVIREENRDVVDANGSLPGRLLRGGRA